MEVPEVIKQYCYHTEQKNLHEKEAKKLAPQCKQLLLDNDYPGVLRNNPRTKVEYDHEKMIEFLTSKFGEEQAASLYKRTVNEKALDELIAAGRLSVAEIPKELYSVSTIDVLERR